MSEDSSGGPHRPLDYRRVTPAPWYRVPLDPDLRDQAVRRLVDRQLVPGDHLPHLRQQLREQLEADARAAYEAGGIEMYLSLLVAGTVPLSSSLVVSFLPTAPGLPPGVELVGDDLQELARILSAASAAGVSVVSSEVVTLGIGPAVRRRLRLTAPLAADGPGPDPDVSSITSFDSFDLEWLIPVPGYPGAFLMLAFSSPILPLEDGLIDLFDAVARTFHWVGRAGAPPVTALEA